MVQLREQFFLIAADHDPEWHFRAALRSIGSTIPVTTTPNKLLRPISSAEIVDGQVGVSADRLQVGVGADRPLEGDYIEDLTIRTLGLSANGDQWNRFTINIYDWDNPENYLADTLSFIAALMNISHGDCVLTEKMQSIPGLVRRGGVITFDNLNWEWTSRELAGFPFPYILARIPTISL